MRFLLLLFLFPMAVVFAAPSKSKMPLVVVSKAMTGERIQQVALTGSVTSARVANISAQVSGIIEQIEVEAGDQLKSGAVLLELDAELASLNLESSHAATLQAEAELTDAKRRHEKGKELRKTNSISTNELDLLEAEAQIKRAALLRQQAEERRQQALVKRHQVLAPFDGVISERRVDVGEWIDPGDPVLTLVSLDKLRAEFRVPQEYFAQVSPDTAVTLNFDVEPGREVRGKIQAIIPVNDPSARTFLIHVVFDQSTVQQTPGMSVRGRLNLASGETTVIVSRDALIRYPDGRITVWTVSQPQGEATVTEQLVDIGPSFNGKVPVLHGLEAGAHVVVKGNESLQEGLAVRIQQTQ